MLKKLFLLLPLYFCLYNVAFSSSNEPQQPAMATQHHHPEEFIKSIENDPQAGKKIYDQFCSTCHARDPNIDVGAPRIGVARDWKPRMQKGLDGLLTVAIVGLNQMPPRGGCFECSNAQLKAAIIYMLPAKTTQK